ncbi:MAG: hypothetical protein EKK63_14680 [Acinetobacter sp.]|uniref:hypothetical protein n=1 Tax=Acinetobacter sp. TaxID=472 RepID=UPI000FA959C2|nr:hypothetical protein [Acinetobacter sp.]RUP37511.1 MAG: hypothetical protein EKK63_14680 [Acinetobacter sp.]
MSITNKLKKLVHRKSWEYLAPLPATTGAGMFMVGDKRNLTPNSVIYFFQTAAAIHRYDGDEDSWVQIPASAATGTFGVGACGDYRGLSAMGGVFTQQATAGGVATITTNRTIVRNLAGRKIRVIGGLGVGYEGAILSNTLGANAVITTDGSTTFDNTTQYQIFGGSLWFQNAGASAGFAVYDVATNAWTNKTAVGVTWGTGGSLVSTPGGVDTFESSTATAGASTTLTNSTKSWLTNQWANSQVRITAGTGIGQIRTITSNTGTVLTVSSAWTVNPDATSQYSIEGNDDYFYLLGNNAVTLYRYSVSANTWTTLTPGAARAGAPGAGSFASWVSKTDWELNSNGSPNALTVGSTVYKQNGRYILAFRGGAANSLDMYDIAANTWISGLDYGNRNETFTTGTNAVDYKDDVFIMKEATGKILKFNINDWAMKSFAFLTLPQGAAVSGAKMMILPYVDSDDNKELVFLYSASQTRQEFLRMLII